MREFAEVDRRAQKLCEAEHKPAHQEFGGTITEGDLR
jgi:hypothetical protein